MAVVFIAAIAAAAVPLYTQAQETVQRVMHPLRYEETIRQASAENGLEPAFVAGVVHTESRFRPDAVSDQGAYGLMQLLPETAEFISRRSGITGDFRDPDVNLRMGAWYLNYLEGRYGDDERLVLAAYNSGEGRVDAWTAREDFDIRRDIPFQETRGYVEDVLETRETYEELYGPNLDRA